MPEPSALRDWLFAKQSKRRLLESLLGDPERSWSRADLTRAAGLHSKARMDLHLQPLLESGLIGRRGNRYVLVPGTGMAQALRELLVELGAELPQGTDVAPTPLR